MVGRNVSFYSSPIFEPILDSILQHSLAFWGAVGGITGVGTCHVGF